VHFLTLTIGADEDTLVRLATLLCYADLQLPEMRPRIAPSLFEQEADEPLPPDPEVLRERVVKHFLVYGSRYGQPQAQALFDRFGITKLSQLPEERLAAFLEELQRALPADL